MSVVVKLPWAPSSNGYWRAYQGRQILSKKAREYRKDVGKHFMIAKIRRMLGPLKVKLWLQPPDKRRRDVDNYSKSTLDALTHAGAWDDDSQIMHLSIAMCEPVKWGQITVEVEELTADDLNRMREKGL